MLLYWSLKWPIMCQLSSWGLLIWLSDSSTPWLTHLLLVSACISKAESKSHKAPRLTNFRTEMFPLPLESRAHWTIVIPHTHTLHVINDFLMSFNVECWRTCLVSVHLTRCRPAYCKLAITRQWWLPTNCATEHARRNGRKQIIGKCETGKCGIILNAWWKMREKSVWRAKWR